MNISILTPHHNQLSYLRRCVESVKNQTIADTSPSFAVSHLIQDSDATGLSGPELHQALNGHEESSPPSDRYRLDVRVEPDNGMYDALNRAFARADGEVIGHLNCDEQYLPGTLSTVVELFSKNPELMVLSGSVIITRPDGTYLCSRVPIPPGYAHTAVCHLALFTAATFYRRSLIEDLGTYFDPSYRAAGDADLIFRMLKKRVRIDTVRDYFSVFIETGENLALSETAKKDRTRRLSEASSLTRSLQPLISVHHQFRKWIHGCYHLKPFSYPFIQEDGGVAHIRVDRPRAVWKSRRKLKKVNYRILGPHNPRTTCPPGRLRSVETGPPHLLILSAPRSGTHMLIDAVLNNLPAYRRKPLYVELDQLFGNPSALDRVLNTRGYVLKSHHPMTPGMRLNEADQAVLDKISRASITVLLTRDPEDAARSALRMWPDLDTDAFKKGMEAQLEYWRDRVNLQAGFSELLEPGSYEQLLQRIARNAKTPLRGRILQPPAKRGRWKIYLLKAMTRILGRDSPRINTGIQLGRSGG